VKITYVGQQYQIRLFTHTTNVDDTFESMVVVNVRQYFWKAAKSNMHVIIITLYATI